MKKRLLSIGVLFLSLLGMQTLYAQNRNVTDFAVANADLEDGTNGWTVTGYNDGPSGTPKVMECFNASWVNRSSYSIKQDVTLPAGTYVLNAYAFYREGLYNASSTVSNAYLVAGEEEVVVKTLASEATDAFHANSMTDAALVFAEGKYLNTLEFTLDEEKTISIGLEGTHTVDNSWFISGPFELMAKTDDAYVAIVLPKLEDFNRKGEELTQTMDYYFLPSAIKSGLESVQDTYWETLADATNPSADDVENYVNDLNAAVANVEAALPAVVAFNDFYWTCLDLADNSTPDSAEALEAYNSAIDEAQAAKNAAKTAEDVNQALADLEAARDAYVLHVVPSADQPFDMTFKIVNNSFETGNTDGWTTIPSSDTGARANADNYATTGTDGDYLFNTWWKGTPITQKIEGLPNGKYRLSVLVASGGGTIYLTANGGHNEGTETGGSYPSSDTFQEATYEFEVIDGTATIGVVGSADGTAGEHKEYREDGYWWYKADNFRLEYLSLPDLAIVSSSLEEGASYDKLAVGSKVTLSTTQDRVIGYVSYEILDETVNEYVKPFAGMTKLEDGSFSAEIPLMDIILYASHTYKAIFTCYATESDFNYGRTPIGTLSVKFNGSTGAFAYSDVKLVSVSPDPNMGEQISADADVEVTMTFDGAVEITSKNAFVVEGGGGTSPLSSIVPNEDKTVWTLTIPASAMEGKEFLSLSVAVTDENGNVVEGNTGDGTTSYFLYEYAISGAAAEFTTSPADGEEVEALSEISFIHADGIAPSWTAGPIEIMSLADRTIVATIKDVTDVIPADKEDDWSYIPVEQKAVLEEAITVPGVYAIHVPAGYFIIGQDQMAQNSAEAYIYITVSAVPAEITVTPADGSVVESLKEFTFEYADGIDVSWTGTMTLTDEEGTVVAEITGDDVFVDYPESLDDPATTASFELPEEITAAGTYVLTIPAGFFIVGSNYDNSPEMVLTYTIGETEPTEVLGVTPADGEEVSELYEFSIEMNKAISLNAACDEAISLYNLSTVDLVASIPVDENEELYYTYNEDNTLVTFVLDQIVTTPGQYKLVIPAGKFLLNGRELNDAIEFTFTIPGSGDGIDAAAADAEKVTVVTLNGVVVLKDADRSALKSLKKGLYIVNGRKVVLK